MDDDIYIMMQCLCVCLSRKIITSHFRAERCLVLSFQKLMSFDFRKLAFFHFTSIFTRYFNLAAMLKFVDAANDHLRERVASLT